MSAARNTQLLQLLVLTANTVPLIDAALRSCAQVFYKYVFRDNRPDDILARASSLRRLLADVLLELPASSVEVEKLHSNTLVDHAIVGSNAKQACSCQMDNYLMSVMLDYNFVKGASQENCLGVARGKFMRMVSKRAYDSTAPRLSLRRKRAALQEEDQVQAEDMADVAPAGSGGGAAAIFPGLQLGTQSVVEHVRAESGQFIRSHLMSRCTSHAACRRVISSLKTNGKKRSRKVSAFNAYQSSKMCLGLFFHSVSEDG